MTVALFPPTTSSPVSLDIEALTEGPRFVRTREMSRWHRPRSGSRYPQDRVVYGAWCGYGIGGSERAGAFLAADEPPAGEPVCGTCEGRAAGAGQDASPTGRLLLFSPRDIDPPKNCPASRTSMYEALPGGRVGQCRACGDHQPLRAMGGPYNPRYAIVQHPTGAALVPPCPFHRWRQLTTAEDGHVLCACGREINQ
ncbi:hypothetical protein ACLVWQ_17730 (plasmid) [Streptomyces sp. CWNU-52B]|uniref:hypothetical protein n=1 Tax=unclassified Streptomyces TaxID=2593676 RepID=UPI0039C26962